MDAITLPHAGQKPRAPRVRLLPGVKLITWLFSLVTRVVLLAILLGVLGFLMLFGYFLFGRTWSMPVVLSAGHERVVQVHRDWMDKSLKTAELDSRVQVLRRQLLETENGVNLARISVAAEVNTIRVEVEQNDMEIDAVERAMGRNAGVRRMASELLAGIEGLPDPEKNFAQGLVNRARFLTDMLARTDLSIKLATLDAALAENGVRLAALQRKRTSLRSAEATVVDGQSGESLSSREFEHVKLWNKATLDLRTGFDEVQRLQQSLQGLEALRIELSSSMRLLAASPLLAAAREPAAVAFVPYGNGSTYQPGQPIYRCQLWLVLCAPIGTIGSLVDGEITYPHPFFRHAVRGSFYSVDLTEKNSAQDALLFSTPPLLI